MSDMVETFRAMREESMARRARYRERGPKLLTEAGIHFVSHNNGAHLCVADLYDFWPGTGLWRSRDGKTRGRGVQKLVRQIRGGADTSKILPRRLIEATGVK